LACVVLARLLVGTGKLVQAAWTDICSKHINKPEKTKVFFMNSCSAVRLP
jgi:hypothetical protein